MARLTIGFRLQVLVFMLDAFLIEPLLEEPELTASAANVILTRRIEDSHTRATADEFLGEGSDELQLPINAGFHGLRLLADDGYRGFPYLRIEEFDESLGIIRRGISLMGAVVVERLTSDIGGPESAEESDLPQSRGVRPDEFLSVLIR